MRLSLLGLAALTATLMGQTLDVSDEPDARTQSMYVGTLDNKIYIYSLGSTAPRLTISQGLASISQIAVDRKGNCYAANFGTAPSYADSSITQYAAGQTVPALTRTNGAFSAFGVAVDFFDNVYASSYYRNTVSVYRPNQVDPIGQLQNGINGPGLLTVHGARLFVGEFGAAQILEFQSKLTLNLKAPGTLPTGALTFGGPFAVGPAGRVYAGGAVVANDLGFEEFVNVFASGATSPEESVVLSTGPGAQIAPSVVVSKGNLFAAAADINSVLQYQIGTQLMLVRTIVTKLGAPGPMAVDSHLNLYVGEPGGIEVYPPGATNPSQTIFPPGNGAPVALVIR